jgi:hypothetical protein
MTENQSKLPGVKKLKRKRRGTVQNTARLDAFKEQRGATQASWASCSSKALQQVICAITELGGAVTIGLSRDLGAHSMTLLLDGGRETLWFNGDADLDDELLKVMGVLESMHEQG